MEHLDGHLIYRHPDRTETELHVAERGGELEVVAVRRSNGITTEALRELPIGRIRAWLNGSSAERLRVVLAAGGEVGIDSSATWVAGGAAPRRPKPLKVPEGRRRPDDFYRQVLDDYGALVALGASAPAKELAEINGQPTTTVHRWLKEARARMQERAR